uniref:Reverse transcriptase domain-containing protein n=1 Tax=Tanacetum cinerariifolium TaxID=118510 RepID=A0A699GKY4_TANCI|nr:hypothetical protein [Tanacetum cinerariifolium]
MRCGGICFHCKHDTNPNSLNFSDYPPQSQYETNICELCGNDAHYGYDCPPHVPFVYNQNPCFDQNFDNNFPRTSPSFPQQNLCYENYRGPHATFQCQPMNQNFYNYNSFSFDQIQPPQYPVIHHPPQETSEEILQARENLMKSIQTFLKKFNRISFRENPKNRPAFYDNDDEHSIQYKEYLENSSNAIAPVLPTKEPDNSLSMGDEHLSTISITKSDEVIKSSVENLVPIPSKFEDFSDNESKCDVPFCDDFTTFSNPLFDSNDDLSSSDDESFSVEDVLKENFRIYPNPLFDNEIISSKIDPHHFNVESALIESFLNRDILMISYPKIDSFLEEFFGELAHIDLVPPGINKADFDPEEEIHLIEELFNDPLPLFENESSNFDHHDDLSFPRPPPEPPDVEAFFDFKPDTGVLTTKVLKGISEHYVLMPNILPTLLTLDPVLDFTPFYDSLGSENKIFDLGIFIEVQSERLLSREEFSISFIRDPLYLVFDTLLSIAPDLEASRARGFVHRPLELQSLAYGNLIS